MPCRWNRPRRLRSDPAFKLIADRSPDDERDLDALDDPAHGGVHADRLSDHRYMVNLFRLYLHCLSHNLQVRTRRLIADPPPDDPHEELPPEALPEHRRRRCHNRRRQHDPLGEGHPGTWRTRLKKVAAEIRVSVRRILVHLPRHWPYLNHFEQLCTAAMRLSHAARHPD